jgi:hypothetical protein
MYQRLDPIPRPLKKMLSSLVALHQQHEVMQQQPVPTYLQHEAMLRLPAPMLRQPVPTYLQHALILKPHREMWFELPGHLQRYRGAVKIQTEVIHLLTVSPEPVQQQTITEVLQLQPKGQLRVEPMLLTADQAVLRVRARALTVAPAAAQVAVAAPTVHQVAVAAHTAHQVAAAAQVAAAVPPTAVQEVQAVRAQAQVAVQVVQAVRAQAQVAVQGDHLQDDK